MAHILFLGGTRFLGLLTCHKLLENQHKVTVLSRRAEVPESLTNKVEYICGNVEVDDNTGVERTISLIKHILEERQISIIIDTIATHSIEIEAIMRGIEQSKKCITQYIYCSSVAAYDNWNKILTNSQMAAHVNEMPIYNILESNNKIVASMPTLQDSTRDSGGAEFCKLREIDATLGTVGYSPEIYSPAFNDFYKRYANGKREVERELMAWANKRGFAYTIMRPSVIEGENDPLARTWYWVQRLLDGSPILIPDTVPQTSYQHVYVEDVAVAFFKVVNNKLAFNQTFNISGNELFSVKEYIFKLAYMLGIHHSKIKFIPISQDIKKTLSWPFEFPIFFEGFSLATSTEKATGLLGYIPSESNSWMRKNVDWILSIKHSLSDSLGYESRTLEVKLAEERES
jgi:nucleoside-diphosphate-sugar epimerase